MAAIGAALLATPVRAQDAAATDRRAPPKAIVAKPAKPAPKAAAKPAAKSTPAKSAAKSGKPDKKTAAKSKPAAKASPAKPAAKPSQAAKSPPALANAPTVRPFAPAAPVSLTPLVSDPALAAPDLAPRPPQSRQPPLVEAPIPPSEADIAAVRRVIEVMRNGRRADALALADNISEPLTRKIAEWIVLRFDDNFVGYARYARFIKANPTWPSINLFRRRAEATLWQERADVATIRDYFRDQEPQTAKGMLALARATLAQGDRERTAQLVRKAWRDEAMTAEMETQCREMFGAFITPGDDKARMERRLHVNDAAAGVRAANRLGGAQPAIAKARIAVDTKAGNAKALVDAVPHDARGDVGYIFARLQLLRRADHFHEAARLMATTPRERSQLYDTDEWWVERRLLARKLLDVNDPKAAYAVARDAAVPSRENYQVEHHFTAGWIALRFLHDPQTAATHFARIAQVSNNPISLARSGYWLGRAAEAMHRPQEARKHYESAARWTTAYYGQLARAKLGLGEMLLYAPAATAAAKASVERLELVRAAEILYALDERNLIRPLMHDLGERLEDVGALSALGEITAKHRDARAMLQLGKAALARGQPFAQYAFPTIGVPDYTPIAPRVEPAIVYSIVRQESAFDPKDVSHAMAMGLMQVTPAAGIDTCKRFGCVYNKQRLLKDMPYNVQVGAAELAALFQDYRGSYILTFAGYNAGRGSVRGWIERYGDPRDPRVDPVDWVERIPFSETRNYVQRVMENMQVYRVRFGGGSQLHIEADLRKGSLTN
jgi:soluble lytic murein transglycosylase